MGMCWGDGKRGQRRRVELEAFGLSAQQLFLAELESYQRPDDFFSAVGNSLLTREFTVEGNKEKGVVRWNNEMLFSSTVLKPSCKLIYSVRNKQARYFQGILTRFWLKTRNVQEIRVRILLKQGQETHGKGSSADSSMHNLFPGFCTIYVHKLFMNRLQILKQTNEEMFINYGIIDIQYVVS